MSKLKWITQRITMLLVVPLFAVGIPFTMATIGKWLGYWEQTDSLLSSNQVFFWVSFLVTRATFGAIWLFGSYWIGETGQKTGWFWFKPDRYYSGREEYSVDKSGMIVAILAAIFILIFISEFAIRVSTLTYPPYLPPPAP